MYCAAIALERVRHHRAIEAGVAAGGQVRRRAAGADGGVEAASKIGAAAWQALEHIGPTTPTMLPSEAKRLATACPPSAEHWSSCTSSWTLKVLSPTVTVGRSASASSAPRWMSMPSGDPFAAQPCRQSDDDCAVRRDGDGGILRLRERGAQHHDYDESEDE
ncbi:MAG: hypothetical protein U0703_05040 [Anaerolineae bacterium]